MDPYTFLFPRNDQPRNRCQMCGHQFEPVADVNACPVCNEVTPRDDLIREDDNYLWTM